MENHKTRTLSSSYTTVHLNNSWLIWLIISDHIIELFVYYYYHAEKGLTSCNRSPFVIRVSIYSARAVVCFGKMVFFTLQSSSETVTLETTYQTVYACWITLYNIMHALNGCARFLMDNISPLFSRKGSQYYSQVSPYLVCSALFVVLNQVFLILYTSPIN